MLVHHVVTVMIMSVSWICNFHRVMIVVHFINNFTGVPLEFGKSARYVTGKPNVFIFGLFTFTWFLFRLIIFPLYYLYGLILAPSHPLIYFNHFLTTIMMVLNVIWSKMIFDVIRTKIACGKMIFNATKKIFTFSYNDPLSCSSENDE
jgi:sphingoid base N-palmitoyltransferase